MSWEEDFPDDEKLMDKLSMHSTGPLVTEDEIEEEVLEESEFAEEEIEEIEEIEEVVEEIEEVVDEAEVTKEEANGEILEEEAENDIPSKVESVGRDEPETANDSVEKEPETIVDVAGKDGENQSQQQTIDGDAQQIDDDKQSETVLEKPIAPIGENSDEANAGDTATSSIDDMEEASNDNKNTSTSLPDEQENDSSRKEATEDVSPPTDANGEEAETKSEEPVVEKGGLTKKWEEKLSAASEVGGRTSSSPNKLPERKLVSEKTSKLVSSADLIKEQEERLGGEMQRLLEDILRIGETGKPEVTFGELFVDPEVEQYYEALVGTLKGAKKRGLINFKGQMLLKGPHDKVVISIIQQ